MISDMIRRLRAGAETSAAIRAALAEVAAAQPRARDALAAVTASRNDLLLTGSNEDILAAEAAMTAARLDLDRLGAAEVELKRRVAQAEAAEHNAALDAERVRVESDAKKFAARLRADYERHSVAIVELLDRLRSHEAAVDAINAKLIEAGRAGDCVDRVETRAIPGCDNLLDDFASIATLTSLRPIGMSAGWGQGRRVAREFGLKP